MKPRSLIHRIQEFIGLENNTTGHAEKWISGFGGLLGIYAIWQVTRQFTSGTDTPLIVASMGASAVLLFAVPHGKLAQPWNLFAGHIFSAIVGVSCARWIPDPAIAAAIAVGLAITVMHYTQSIHPPGGATALMAVIGGPSIHELGYSYAIAPVLINTVVILTVAFLVNLPFAWRRYPAGWIQAEIDTAETTSHLQHSDLQYALQKCGSIVAITESELEHLFVLAETHAQYDHLPVAAINVGHFYSNGELGTQWSVRQIIDGPENSTDEDDKLVYKVIAGDALHETGMTSRLELSRWARHEVEQNDAGWQRVPATEDT